jgi:hypothetical protein
MRKVCMQLALTFKPGSMRSLKAAEQHPAVNIMVCGESIGEHLYLWCATVDSCSMSTHYYCVKSSQLEFLCAPFMATYNTLEALVHTWSAHFVPFWMKSNGSPMMVLDTWLTKP